MGASRGGGGERRTRCLWREGGGGATSRFQRWGMGGLRRLLGSLKPGFLRARAAARGGEFEEPGAGGGKGIHPEKADRRLKREERSRGEWGAQAEELRTPGSAAARAVPPGPATWRWRVSLAGGTSPSRGEVPKVASGPASVAGRVARRLQTRVVLPESAEDGMDRHSWGLGFGGGRRTPFSCSLAVAFTRNTPWSPEAGRRMHPERNGALPSPRGLMAPLRTSLGREHEVRAGAHLFLGSREETSPGFIPFPFQPRWPSSPTSLQVIDGVSLDHRTPNLSELEIG